MKNKLLILIFGSLILTGVSTSAIKAQILQTETKQVDEASLIVNSQPISNTFYEGLKENKLFKSSNFKLIKAFIVIHKQEENAVRIGNFEESYFIEFQNVQNTDEEILVTINKYKSPELASEMLNTFWYSQGSVEATKELGDEGIKAFDDRGRFTGIRFRKGNFTIGIGNKSEELLKVFADNALKAIEGK